jgi:hypothetical protein
MHDPTEDRNETVTTINGRTASADYVRRALTEDDITEVVYAYRSGTTAQSLANRYGVHINTIKRNLRRHGVLRSARIQSSSDSPAAC